MKSKVRTSSLNPKKSSLWPTYGSTEHKRHCSVRIACNIADFSMELVGKENPELQKIVELIPSIYHRGQKIAVKEPIDPASLLPETLSYWTYLGSLTTPPCSESVTWILFKEAIEVSEDQLAAFRSLRCYKPGEACPCDELEGLIINNYRPPLPLGNRELRECGSA